MTNSDNLLLREIRFDWNKEEILEILNMPLIDLMWESQIIHRKFNNYNIQLASLFSVKTGGCEENCSYCSQSIYSASEIKSHPQLQVKEVLARAEIAKNEGADRFCMGWAWREIRDGKSFNAMLEMVSGVRDLGMEACVTAGMLTEEQASRLADAGLTAYNHNLDTSPEHYKNIITTRTYQDRLDTIKRVRNAGINVCCGGIIGLGETNGDRASLLEVLSNMNPHPESVPINSLVAIEGTGLEDNQEIIRHNVHGLLGMLPSDQFDVKITSSKDNIANLLSSAMMTGYFLRQMEQRKELEQTLKNDENMSIEE